MGRGCERHGKMHHGERERERGEGCRGGEVAGDGKMQDDKAMEWMAGTQWRVKVRRLEEMKDA
jgi:hypothetical protein